MVLTRLEPRYAILEAMLVTSVGAPEPRLMFRRMAQSKPAETLAGAMSKLQPFREFVKHLML